MKLQKPIPCLSSSLSKESLALQQIQINQFAIANSEVNSFKYYETVKELLKAFRYNLTMYNKSSANLVKSIVLTFNQSRGYYVTGYIDDGSIHKRFTKKMGELTDSTDSLFLEEADLSFLRSKFHDALKNQIYELTGRDPIVSNEADAESNNWCIFQGPIKSEKAEE